jgi:ABC-type Zn uptake system ZnuABC Zn-binding protein ZnuA
VRLRRAVTTAILAGLLASCTTSGAGSDTSGDLGAKDARPVVVATSSIVADVVGRIAGDTVELVALVPNAVDTHTYEPKASELRALDEATLVFVPDADLNPGITQVVNITAGRENVIDLNASALDDVDYVYRDPQTRQGRNVHTWTDPLLTRKWIPVVVSALGSLLPGKAAAFAEAGAALEEGLDALDRDITEEANMIAPEARKLVVYHDAWEYFGRRYGFTVVGALQAVDFSEPSAAEVAAMAEQIKRENVPAFFGSEVFPSDVMDALERESGAVYVPDLADDRLPGAPGEERHNYVSMMRGNLAAIIGNLAP